MKSEQFSDYGEALCSHDYPTPVPEANQVLIKIDACGVCHSDIHVWEGYFDLGGNHKIGELFDSVSAIGYIVLPGTYSKELI